ncbi:MAG: glycosyltransferase family 39 protein [Armatimonadetes bacterium]|nr:glycosyltransferase family 39 protein [Armatimonadota bacterium]
MSSRTAFICALLLCVVHFVLSLVFSAATPYRTAGVLLGQRDPNTGGPQFAKDIGAPDERQHANYVQRLMDGRGFGVLGDPSEDPYENYQAHQPPLYYILSAAVGKVIGANPASAESPSANLRAVNGLIGAAGVLGVYFLLAWGLGRPDLGAIAAAIPALLPMNVALSGAMSNDPLLIALCTWTVAVLALCMREGWTMKRSVVIGVLIGAALLTKSTALALVPVALLAGLVLSKDRAPAKLIGVSAAIALLMVTPWWVRNQKLYGDPLALKAFNAAFTGNPTRELMTEVAAAEPDASLPPAIRYWTDWVGWWVGRSTVGAFGYMDVFMNERGVPSTGPRNPNLLYRLCLVALLGLLAAATLGWGHLTGDDELAPPLRKVLAVLSVTVAILFVGFTMKYFQGQARYIFPAMAAISTSLALGLWVATKRNAVASLVIAVVALGYLDFVALNTMKTEFPKRIQAGSVQPG